jgi:type II secretory pathway pseudopilin PulG
MRDSERGFTLFEVLGAVALLAIVYSTLATVAIRGVRSESESRRTLEASLRADSELAVFELQIENGQVPELGIRESDEGEDGLIVTWEVTPFTPQFGGDSPTDPFAVESEVSVGTGGLAEMFASSDSSAPPFLEILLTVSWRDGATVRSVTRTTFMVDEAVASERIEQLAQLATEELGP